MSSVMQIAMREMGQLIELANANLKYLPGPVLNVGGFGAVADGETDVTSIVQSVIDEAIAKGQRSIFFPHGSTGEYYVTSLTDADQVDFMGDNCSFVGGYSGTITNIGGLGEHLADVVTDSGGVHGLEIESGTWTPTLFGGTTAGTPTYTAATGKYYKIGNEVFLTCTVRISAIGGMTGSIRIGGLPFTPVAATSCSYGQSAWFDLVDSPKLSFYIAASSSFISIYKDVGVSSDAPALDAADIKNNTYFFGLSCSFQVA